MLLLFFPAEKAFLLLGLVLDNGITGFVKLIAITGRNEPAAMLAGPEGVDIRSEMGFFVAGLYFFSLPDPFFGFLSDFGIRGIVGLRIAGAMGRNQQEKSKKDSQGKWRKSSTHKAHNQKLYFLVQ